MDEPRTLLEAVAKFSNPQVAHDFFVALRWPNGIACPRPGCGSADVAKISTRNAWRCRECNRQFTAKVNTVFEDSPIGFDRWLPAMWMLSNCRNGVSSCEIARALGVTQKTAWFMLVSALNREPRITVDFRPNRATKEIHHAQEPFLRGANRRHPSRV